MPRIGIFFPEHFISFYYLTFMKMEKLFLSRFDMFYSYRKNKEGRAQYLSKIIHRPFSLSAHDAEAEGGSWF